MTYGLLSALSWGISTLLAAVAARRIGSYGRLAGMRRAYTSDTEATHGGSIGPGRQRRRAAADPAGE